jgi:putative tryptophan/tyrosine transport system substrate-binding protein
MMLRREFITLLGAAVATWPPVARAQQPVSPVVGFLGDASPESMARRVAAFRQGLDEIGYVEGRNVTIDWRSAERQPNRLRTLAADLVGRRVAVIVTTSDLATLAAKTATSAIPIVFLSAGDPVRNGLVAGLDRPSGNVTGLSWFGADLAPARLSLLHQLVPKAAVIGLLVDSNLADAITQLPEVQAAADAAGLDLVVLHAGSASDIDAAFASLVGQRVGALVVGARTLFTGRREQLIGLAARHGVPAIYAAYEISAAGGLASYGHSATDAFRRAGVYTGWILKGAGPDRSPGPAVIQARADHQSQDRQDARPRSAAESARRRRRGDPIGASRLEVRSSSGARLGARARWP